MALGVTAGPFVLSLRAVWCFLLAWWLSVKMCPIRMACSDVGLFALCDGLLFGLCSLTGKQRLGVPSQHYNPAPIQWTPPTLCWSDQMEYGQRHLPDTATMPSPSCPIPHKHICCHLSFCWFLFPLNLLQQSRFSLKINSVKQGHFTAFSCQFS